MSSHHDHDNHSAEPKEVAFRTPLIMGLVTVLIILLAVSTCDNKHVEHETNSTEHGTETHEAVTEEHTAVADTLAKTDTTAVKVEEHAQH